MSTASPSRRKGWLDACRALAVLFVIYGHDLKTGTAFFVLTSPVKVTMFFVISGYLFNDRGGNVRVFFKTLLLKLVVPWLILALPQSLARALVSGGAAALPGALLSVISGELFWYMPCCIVAEILFFFVMKYARSLKQAALCCVLLCALGFGMVHMGWGRFARLDTALICQVYLLFGLMYRRWEERIAILLRGNTAIKLLCAALLYVLLAVADRMIFPDRALNINNNSYGLLPVTMLSILVGCWTLFEIAKRIQLPRILCFIGENTLLFYMLEQAARGFFKRGYAMLGISLPAKALQSLLVCIPACAALGILALLVNRFFPIAVGKRRK